MAGFSNIGEAGYRLSPPLMGPQTGSQGYAGIGINRPTRNYSPYFNPQQYGMSNQGDSSGQHQANVYMSQMGLGETGQQRTPGLADYGFSAGDWANVNRYMSNPQSTQYRDDYTGLRDRLRGQADTNPMFGSWLPEQKDWFASDFPIRAAAGYNLVPPPILQSWGMSYPSSQQGNLRF